MNKTTIEWAEATWNPATGCGDDVVSAGCRNCYARRMSRRLAGRAGYPPADTPEGGSFAVTRRPDRLAEPIGWREARRVFVCSMGDLFHAEIPLEYIAAVYGAMLYSRLHTFCVLTKRPARRLEFQVWLAERGPSVGEWIADRDGIPWSGDLRAAAAAYEFGLAAAGEQGLEDAWLRDAGCLWPPPNAWEGVTVENQAAADERIPILLETPAAVRFVSVEPLIGPVHLGDCRGLDWVIAGGETGPGARPMHPDWPRALRDQCVAAGTPFFFKHWGEWAPIHGTGRLTGDEADEVRPFCWAHADGSRSESGCEPEALMLRLGRKRTGRLLDGRTWDQAPSAPSEPLRSGRSEAAR